MLVNIGSGNGMAPYRRQGIPWTNIGVLIYGNKYQWKFTRSIMFLFTKMWFGKWQPFRSGLNELIPGHAYRDMFYGSFFALCIRYYIVYISNLDVIRWWKTDALLCPDWSLFCCMWKGTSTEICLTVLFLMTHVCVKIMDWLPIGTRPLAWPVGQSWTGWLMIINLVTPYGVIELGQYWLRW